MAGLTMIARRAESTLERSLTSVKDHLSPIVIALAGIQDDKTEEIARSFTPHVYPYEGQLLPDGGIANFADARNFSLQKFVEITGPDHWFVWMDADDVMENPARVAILEKEMQGAREKGCWLPYYYSFLDDGVCNTIFLRERLMYNPTMFFWANRVHEVIIPKLQVGWRSDNDVRIMHMHREGGSRSLRNLSLLTLMYKENKNDRRVRFYLGHQYFADAQGVAEEEAAKFYVEAVKWYESYIEVADNPYEKWQAFIYLAKCYRKLGKVEFALSADLAAVGMQPNWRDSWYDLAETYAYMSEWEKCLKAAEVASGCRVPPRILFINPLDEVGYNAGLFSEVALFHTGQLDAAYAKVKELRKIHDMPQLLAKQQTYEDFMKVRDGAEAWLTILEGKSDQKVLDLMKEIPRHYFTIPEIQDKQAQAKMRIQHKASAGKRTVQFFCGTSIETWSPKSINTTGIGGSETAVINIAKLFAKDGWHVDVFNSCGRDEGEHDGVNYWQAGRFDKKYKSDLLILWRCPMMLDEDLGSKNIWLWMHDLHHAEQLNKERAQRCQKIIGVSAYHIDYLRMIYPFIPWAKFDFAPNGINLERFQDTSIERKRHKVIYLSSPDRGLDTLLNVWPNVLKGDGLGDAELHVYYGFNNLEIMAKNMEGIAIFVERMKEHMNKPNVFNRGRLPQDELAKEIMSASLWAYPTGFLETSAISAMECMAAGTPMLTSAVGALPETIGNAGVLIEGHSRNDNYMYRFLGTMFAFLKIDDFWNKYSVLGLERSKQFTWENSYAKWKNLCQEITCA